MGTYDQGLGLVVGDTSDTVMAAHFLEITLKFGSERGILDIVNGPVKAFLFGVKAKASASRAEMGMIVHAEE